MQSHYELFCVMLGRLEVVKLVISAKLASDFISLHCNCLAYDGPDTTSPAQRKFPLSLFQSCQFHFGSLWLHDPALHTTMSIRLPKIVQAVRVRQGTRRCHLYVLQENAPSSLADSRISPVQLRPLSHYGPFISLE